MKSRIYPSLDEAILNGGQFISIILNETGLCCVRVFSGSFSMYAIICRKDYNCHYSNDAER